MDYSFAPPSHSQFWSRFGQAPHIDQPSGARTPDFVQVYRTDYDLKPSFGHRLQPVGSDSPDQFSGYPGDYNTNANIGYYSSMGAETPRGHYMHKDLQADFLLQRLRAVEYEQTQDPESSSSGGSWSQEGLPLSPLAQAPAQQQLHKQQPQKLQQQQQQHQQTMLPPPPPPPPMHHRQQQYRPPLNLEGLYQSNEPSMLSRNMGLGADPLPVGLVRQDLPIQVSPPSSPHIPMPQLFRAPPGLALDMTAQDSLNSSGESACAPPPPPAPHAEARPAKKQPVVISMGTVGHPTSCAGACDSFPCLMGPACAKCHLCAEELRLSANQVQVAEEGPSCPSVGSMNHPHNCADPCKFAGKPKGCKDGTLCTRCHLCRWRRFPVKK